MFNTVAEISEAVQDGGYHIQPFYKLMPSSFGTANVWWDCTMAGTLPKASYYSATNDLEFTAYPAYEHFRHYTGGNVSPKQKILKSILIHGSGTNLTPSRFMLCDYLGYYAGISWETTEPQILTNPTALTRYADGKGVKAFMVQLFGNNANSIYTINYRNIDGVDVTSQTLTGNALTTGAIQNAQTNATYLPFMQLGDNRGLTRVNSITVSGLGAGIAVLVLVKPLAEITFRDSSLLVPTEVDYFTNMQKAPIIYDNACLNFLFTSVGSPAALLVRGFIEYVWK
jgi:hypothetical protein